MTLADLVLYISFQSRRVELDSLTSVGNRISFQTELALRLDGGQRFQVIFGRPPAVCRRQPPLRPPDGGRLPL